MPCEVIRGNQINRAVKESSLAKSTFDSEQPAIQTEAKQQTSTRRPPVSQDDVGLIAFELSYTTKDLFDRFIFQRTSDVPDVIKRAYVSHAKVSFTVSSRQVATDLFSRYVDYKVALSSTELDIDLATHSLRDISYKLDEREDLRRAYFSENEYHYLFSRDAKVDEAALARLALAQESHLSKEVRKGLIVESIKAGNSEERTVFQPTLNMHRINEIKRAHGSLNDRYNAVAAEFGPEVAERLTQTWKQQAEWKSRVAEFERYRDTLKQQSLTAQAFEEALADYQSQKFSVNEIKRLKVLTSL